MPLLLFGALMGVKELILGCNAGGACVGVCTDNRKRGSSRKKERITDDLSTSKGKWKEKLSRDEMRELDHGRSNSNLPERGFRASKTIVSKSNREESEEIKRA